MIELLKTRIAAVRARLGKSGAGAALVYAGATVVTRAASILLAPLYTRKLTPSDYGELGLAQTVVSILPTLFSLGLASAAARFYYADSDVEASTKKMASIATWMTLFVVVSTGALVGLTLLLAPVSGTGIFQRWELCCILVASAGSALVGIPATYLRLTARPAGAAAVQLGEFFATLLSAILLVAWLNRGLRGAIEAVAVGGVLNVVIGLTFCLGKLRGRLDPAILREGLGFSLPLVPHYLATQLVQISDRWVMKWAGQTASLGPYALASQVSTPVSVAVQAWHEAATPQLGEAFREGGLAMLRQRIGGVVKQYVGVTVVLSLGVIVMTPVAVRLLGRGFESILWITPLFCLCLLVEAFYLPYANVLFFADKTSILPRVTILAGVLSLGTNILLTPRLGIYGAILARLVAGGVRSALVAWAAAKAMRGEEPSEKAPPPSSSAVE